MFSASSRSKPYWEQQLRTKLLQTPKDFTEPRASVRGFGEELDAAFHVENHEPNL
jgi:hypothetical protein